MNWNSEADVVVIGAGATGLPAAIVAREEGCSVIVVEAQPHAGGHAMISGGNVPLGGGTSAQLKAGIEDSPDLVFADLTDWSIVQPNGFPDYRYNDREIVRAFADHNVSTFDWLLAHGVVFADKAPDDSGRQLGRQLGASRDALCAARLADGADRQAGRCGCSNDVSTGAGLMHPLIAHARGCGVELMLEHKMISLVRETPTSGRVVGIEVEHRGVRRASVRARRW